jgi:hypothetical protein
MKKIGMIGTQIIHSYGYGMHINEFDLDFAIKHGKAIPEWQLNLMKQHPDTRPLGGARLTHVSGGLENVPEDMAGAFGLKVTKTVEETIEACDLIMVMDEQIPSRSALIRKTLEAGKPVFADKLFSDDRKVSEELVMLAEEKGVMAAGWSQMGFCPELDAVGKMAQGGIALAAFNMKPEILRKYCIHAISPVQVCFPGRLMEVKLISKEETQRTVFIVNDSNTKIILTVGTHVPGGIVRMDYFSEGEAVLVEGKDKHSAFRRAAREVVNMANGIKPKLYINELMDASMVLEEICG